MNAANRLSKDRVDRLLPDNPEREKLYDLSDGMVIPHSPTFVPNASGIRTPPRDLYLKVHCAVDKMLFALHEQGLAFILPEAVALENIPELNCCKAHWAKKKGKRSGRPIGDLSNGDGTPLNSEYAKLEAEKRWGVIHHPTTADFVLTIFNVYEESKLKDQSVTWDDLVIWTMDLAGAYTLLSFRPENANLMGMTLSNERIFIFLCGVFGWTGTPAAFQVVTRALKYEMDQKLIGKVLIYVDDIMGACLRKDLTHDMEKAKTICIDLLGPNGVADDKSKSGRRLNLIGYIVDLDKKTLSIARKNFLNTVYGFYTVDTKAQTTLSFAQKLASWASRYSMIFRHMRPFSSALHQATCGRSNEAVSFKFRPEAQRSIQMWRTTLALVELNEEQFARSLFAGVSFSRALSLTSSIYPARAILSQIGSHACTLRLQHKRLYLPSQLLLLYSTCLMLFMVVAHYTTVQNVLTLLSVDNFLAMVSLYVLFKILCLNVLSVRRIDSQCTQFPTMRSVRQFFIILGR